jgi:hypothetical protein
VTRVLRLAVALLPTADGGRRRPLSGRAPGVDVVRRRVSAREGFAPSCTTRCSSSRTPPRSRPGAEGVVRAYPVLPEELPRDLAPGRAFALVEGPRTVARARLLAVLADPAPAPLADLAAAKRRALDPA